MEDAPLARTPHRLRAIGFAAAGVVLAWLVISKSLVAFLAVQAPQAALWLSPDDPQALLNLAETRLEPATPEGLADARAWAERALAGDPIDPRALRVLGQIAAAAGDQDRARVYMEAAARRWVHESAAVHWLVLSDYQRKDYAGALHFADILLRTQSRALGYLLPVLGRMAEDPEAVGHLEKLLASNPPWRQGFLRALPRAVTDARTPLRLLLAVRDGADAPTLADVRDYVSMLMQHRFYELAYYTWLQFLPHEQVASAGALFNGSFELTPSGLPFDWAMHGGNGAVIDIAQRPDRVGQRALYVALGPGRVELDGAWQTLLLAPGTYRLNAKYQGRIDGPRGLVWRVACAGSGSRLGQSAMMIGAAPVWKEVTLSFTVPPEKECRAQELRLALDARMPSEQLVSGTAWIDELSIVRDE
jgi:tetratricopeptide (TPR) repeat protein